MNETLMLALTFAAGLLLGAFFFGGLWWTVRKGMSVERPALLFLGSLLLRTSVTVAGIYVVGDGNWQRLLASLLGFFIVRFIATRLVGPSVEYYGAPAKEAGHAP
jgi:F1F0 ATPase subunit 2